MTIETANIIRTSFGLSFDETITIMGLHYGKDEWLVDLEIKESPVYYDVIQFLTELDSKAVKVEVRIVDEVINHLKQCKRNKGIPVRQGTIPKSDKDRITRWIKDGFTLEDFKAVNEYFTNEWAGTDNQKYLIPATLYKGGSNGWTFPAKVEIAKEAKVQPTNFSDAL